MSSRELVSNVTNLVDLIPLNKYVGRGERERERAKKEMSCRRNTIQYINKTPDCLDPQQNPRNK